MRIALSGGVRREAIRYCWGKGSKQGDNDLDSIERATYLHNGR